MQAIAEHFYRIGMTIDITTDILTAFVIARGEYHQPLMGFFHIVGLGIVTFVAIDAGQRLQVNINISDGINTA